MRWYGTLNRIYDYLTELDFDIYQKFYKWTGTPKILKAWTSKRGRLPNYLLDQVADYYEKKAEPYRTTEYCNAHPYNRFSTFNVLIKRTVLVETPFHPTFTKYGFEDTFMGVELGEKKAKVVYINNPLMHMGFDSNDVFLKKTETSLAMLSSAGEMLLPYTRIGQVINKCEKWHVTDVINIFFKITKPLLRKNLLGNSPNMNIFAFYKLGYYIGIAK